MIKMDDMAQKSAYDEEPESVSWQLSYHVKSPAIHPATH